MTVCTFLLLLLLFFVVVVVVCVCVCVCVCVFLGGGKTVRQIYMLFIDNKDSVFFFFSSFS